MSRKCEKGEIKSSAISVRNAISELVGVDTSNKQNQQLDLAIQERMLVWSLAVRHAIKK